MKGHHLHSYIFLNTVIGKCTYYLFLVSPHVPILETIEYLQQAKGTGSQQTLIEFVQYVLMRVTLALEQKDVS